jgi:hypothetical protein
VFNVLLQVLDDGRLTVGQARTTVDFRNTLIVADLRRRQPRSTWRPTDPPRTRAGV